MDTQHLALAAKSGDKQALSELLRHIEPVIFRYGMRMCRQQQDAEDVLQDTMLAIARSIEDYRADSNITTWAFTIARNFCSRRRKKEQDVQAHSTSLEPDELPHAALSLDAQSIQQESWQQVEAALNLLSDEYREMLVLRDIEGMKASEVADVLHLSLAAVKSRLHRSRKALREALGTIEAFPDCPDIVDAFSKKLEGDLSSSACAEMEEHMKSCPRCSAVCTSLQHDLKLCKMAPQAVVPSELSERIRQQVRALF